MLIDCDTCTVRGQGCDDCVVTVLLGAPPGWRGSDPTVVPLTRRPVVGGAPPRGAAPRSPEAAHPHDPANHHPAAGSAGDAPGRVGEERDVASVDDAAGDAWSVVELDEVERRAVQALADFGLVPPLRHQDASKPGDRHVG